MVNRYLAPVITIPSSLQIIAVTRSYPMVTTVEIANDSTEANVYQPKQLVRFKIPWSHGMWQLDGMIGKIIEISGLVITIDIDSTNFDIFSVPVSGETPATIAPFGSRNLEYNNDTKFVSFQSLNNIGN